MVGLVQSKNEDVLEHFDDVIVGVIVIVEQDDAVEGNQLLAFSTFRFGRNRGF